MIFRFLCCRSCLSFWFRVVFFSCCYAVFGVILCVDFIIISPPLLACLLARSASSNDDTSISLYDIHPSVRLTAHKRLLSYDRHCTTTLLNIRGPPQSSNIAFYLFFLASSDSNERGDGLGGGGALPPSSLLPSPFPPVPPFPFSLLFFAISCLDPSRRGGGVWTGVWICDFDGSAWIDRVGPVDLDRIFEGARVGSAWA